MTIRSKQTTTLKITRVKGTSSTGKDTHDYVNLSVNPELFHPSPEQRPDAKRGIRGNGGNPET